MSKEILKSFVIGTFLAAPFMLNAQAQITEIMYDIEGTDSGREWVEIRNVGSDPIDLTLWKLFEANTNHKITAVGSAELLSGAFAVIADNPDKFKADNPGFSGPLFDSAFSLSNAGEELSIKNADGTVIDSIIYDTTIGGGGDGNSLQRSGSMWIAALPTPGSQTTATETQSPPSQVGGTSDAEEGEGTAPPTVTAKNSSHSSQEAATISYSKPELEVSAGRPRLGFVGVPLHFEAKARSIKNVPLGNVVQSVWSMGDGAQRSGQFISHTYEFPGDYIVVLNSDIGGAGAVSRVNVRIVEPKVSISSMPGYIEVSNLDQNELNIGGWIVESEKERFVVAQDTLISSRSSIKIPTTMTKIAVPSEFVRIATPSGKIMAQTAASDGSSASAGVSDGQGVFVPEQLTEEVVRARIMAVLENGFLDRSDPMVASEVPALAVTEPLAGEDELASLPPSDTSAPERSATSTLPAAVIYTVPDRLERNWWTSLKSIFGK